MWVPAPYKQTKNQTNATTDITAGHVIERYVEIQSSTKNQTNDNDHWAGLQLGHVIERYVEIGR